MSEQEPVEETIEQETDEQQIDTEKMSAEELGKYIDDPESYTPPEPETKEEEPETEEESTTEEKVEEEPTEPEEEEETETAEPEEPEITEESLKIQDMELRAKEAELKASRFESLVGRDAGKIGYLEQQIKALREQPAARTATESFEETPPVSDPAILSDIAGLKQSQETILSGQLAGAIESVTKAFMANSGRDFNDKEFMEPFVEGLQKSGVDFGKVHMSNDPKAAASEVKFACESALVYVERKENAKLKEQLAARSVDSSKKMRDKKRAMSASKPPSTKAPPKKVKTVEDMTMEEHAAYVDSVS